MQIKIVKIALKYMQQYLNKIFLRDFCKDVT